MDLYNGRLFATTWRDALSFIRSFVRSFVYSCCPISRTPVPIIFYVTLDPCASAYTYSIYFPFSFFRTFAVAVFSFHHFFLLAFASLSLIPLLFRIFHRIVLHDYTRHRWTHTHTYTIVFCCRCSRLYCIQCTKSFAIWSWWKYTRTIRCDEGEKNSVQCTSTSNLQIPNRISISNRRVLCYYFERMRKMRTKRKSYW